MKYLLFIFGISGLIFFMFGQKTSSFAESYSNPLVVELFTSQSCSSCPPADEVLADIAKAQNVIALSCHVTYWNYLHWKDTLSQKFCTQRQRSYAAAKNTKRVYTPQMIVNGEYAFVGSRRNQAAEALKKATQNEPVQTIKLKKDENLIIATLPELKGQNIVVTAFTTQSAHTQKVPSGENRGKTLHYTNAVLDEFHFENYDTQKRSLTLSLDDIKASDNIIFIAQEAYGRVIAAGKISL